jgi:trehalose synthase-fused probable maltokinase
VTARPPSAEALAAWLPQQRWFASKRRRIGGVAIEDTVPIAGATFAIAAVRLDDGAIDRYALLLRPGPAVVDALGDVPVGRALLDLVGGGGCAPGRQGELRGVPTHAFPRQLPIDLTVRRLDAEQSNTSVVLGDALILKYFRRLHPGINPDGEITRFLTERTAYANTPRLAGHLEYQRRRGETLTLGVVQDLVVGARDGWEWMLAQLAELYERARAAGPQGGESGLLELSEPLLQRLCGLGRRIGELHMALASDADDPAFAPEPIAESDLSAWVAAVRAQVAAAQAAVGRPLSVEELDLTAGLRALRGRQKIRHHGDLHLGQTLYRAAADDFMIIDFEGEPARPLSERRRKHAALRDLAGMLRSLDYAVMSAGPAGVEAWAQRWEAAARQRIVAGYLAAAAGAGFLPATGSDVRDIVAVFELEKAAYEIVYEANHRPEWLSIPTRGFAAAVAALAGAETLAGGAGGPRPR